MLPCSDARSHQLGQALDETGIGAHRRGAAIIRHARFARKIGIFDIQLDQGFGMFADKGDGRDDHALAFRAGAADFGIGRGPDPFQRPDPALIADRPVQIPLSPAASTSAAAVCSTCH